MSIQFTFFLGLYAIAVIVIAIIAGLNIYHIIKYGKGSKGSHLLLVTFLIGMAIILSITIILLLNIDLSQSVELFKNTNTNNFLNF